MTIIKKKYYLYIEKSDELDLSLIKRKNKFAVIYRNNQNKEKISNLIKFRNNCRNRGVKLYIANNVKLFNKCKADGLYISAYNKKYYHMNSVDLIGSAHNFKDIKYKIKQGCKTIILSRLFRTDYRTKKTYYGLIKFNLFIKKFKLPIVALGGIRLENLNKLNFLNSYGFAILSEIKKKPAIISRLF